jgi:hypothetical protein
VGNFKTRVDEAGKEQTISHGVIVLAVGGQERQTELYLNGKHPGVLTQRKLKKSCLGRCQPSAGSHNPPVCSGNPRQSRARRPTPVPG